MKNPYAKAFFNLNCQGELVLTPRSVAGGQFNKITDQNWKLNIDLRRQLNGGAVQIINVNSIMLVHKSISRWYDPINGSKKFLSSDYLWIGKLGILKSFLHFHYV